VSDFGKGTTSKINSQSQVQKQFLKLFEKAPKGSIMPVYKTLAFKESAIDFFSLLSEHGRNENCIMLESADIMKKYGEKSLGGTRPCLKATGKKEKFEIIALNKLGKRLLKQIAPRLDFCDEKKVSEEKIEGILKPTKEIVSEQDRLKTKTHADILRAIAFCFKPYGKKFTASSGLFGAISYDFIDQFENLPKAKKDLLNDPDYEMLFLDSLFLIDHEKKEVTFIANAFKTGKEDSEEISRCARQLDFYEKVLEKVPKKQKREFEEPKEFKLAAKSDCSKEEYMAIVEKCKQRIVKGDVFQIVPSRTIEVETKAEPLDIYRNLRRLNPSPYMFYMNTKTGILLGSSPETFLKVEGGKSKRVEIRPIAGTRPRGRIEGKIDKELDLKLEKELKADKKELAEHTMLVDLARNDVARVSKPGTRIVDKAHYVERFSHVMHLVSKVSGELRPKLDALHAYLASMNMGTLTGAPKVKAMELLRKFEKTKRGFYGGSVGYFTPAGDFDSAIVIRSMKIKKGKAFIRVGGGVVYDSVPEKEYEETENKAKACLNAIAVTEALK